MALFMSTFERGRARQQARLAGFYLKTQVLGIYAALSQTARDEPKAGLSGADEHIAQFRFLTKAPDRTHASGDVLAT